MINFTLPKSTITDEEENIPAAQNPISNILKEMVKNFFIIHNIWLKLVIYTSIIVTMYVEMHSKVSELTRANKVCNLKI